MTPFQHTYIYNNRTLCINTRPPPTHSHSPFGVCVWVCCPCLWLLFLTNLITYSHTFSKCANVNIIKAEKIAHKFVTNSSSSSRSGRGRGNRQWPQPQQVGLIIQVRCEAEWLSVLHCRIYLAWPRTKMGSTRAVVCAAHSNIITISIHSPVINIKISCHFSFFSSFSLLFCFHSAVVHICSIGLRRHFHHSQI